MSTSTKNENALQTIKENIKKENNRIPSAPNKTYSNDFKLKMHQKAIKALTNKNTTVKEVCLKAGVSLALYYNWKKKIENGNIISKKQIELPKSKTKTTLIVSNKDIITSALNDIILKNDLLMKENIKLNEENIKMKQFIEENLKKFNKFLNQ